MRKDFATKDTTHANKSRGWMGSLGILSSVTQCYVNT